jgi:hypothetical protein
MKGYTQEVVKLCTSLVYSIKGDIALARPIAEKLGLDMN